jgi:hypothetical protein
MAAGMQDGFRAAVGQVHRFVPNKVHPQEVHHKAEDMVEGQESQRPAGHIIHDAAVEVVQQFGVEHLLADRFLVVHKDAAGGGGARCAQRHAVGKVGRKALGRFGRLEQILRQHLHIALVNQALFLGDNADGPRFLEHVARHLVAQVGVQQQSVAPGHDQPPENGEPFLAGFLLDGHKPAVVVPQEGL